MSTIEINSDGAAAARHEIVPSVSLENLTRQRAAALERYDQAIALLNEANAIGITAHLGGQRFLLDEFGRREILTEPAGREALRRSLDACGWQYLMNESGLRTFMDAKARQDWDHNISKGDIPELTLENIQATFSTIHASRGELFERGVLEIYRRLSWRYKTNTPVKFGKRIIVNHLLTVARNNGSDYWAYLNHNTTNELDDLVRVFSVLEGQPQPDHRQGMFHLIHVAQDARQSELDHRYFHLRWFKKGSVHLTFKRPELVDQLNRILAKHHPNALAAPH